MTAIQLKKIIKRLTIKDITYSVIDVYNNSQIEASQEIEGKQVTFYICFPKGFPYQFPEIIVKNKELRNLPHIDRDNGKICLFKQEAKPNHNKPIEVITESILQAQKIISDGINGFNKEDFIEEFNAYWNEEIIGIIDVLFEPSDEVVKIKYAYNKEYNFWCCGSTYEEVIQYAQRNYEKSELIIKDAIYIPLSKRIYPPFPNTNKEFFKILINEKNYKEYEKFLTNRTGNSLIIFSQKDKEQYMLSSIIHTGIGNLQGFRNGKIAPKVAYLMTYPNNKILKLGTDLVNRKRLFYRGGDGNMLNKKTAVLGCGSIGGYIVNSLAEMGIKDFKLVDNDILKKENIARHICGLESTDMRKVEAIKHKMEEHYIGMKIETYYMDLYKIISENLEELEDREIIFIAVGDKSLESYLIEKYNERKIKGKLIIVWVEPYIVGGHAIILNKVQNDIEKNIYDFNWELKNRVLETPGEFTKKEAGCQNSFIQYSGFEANLFIHNLLDKILNNQLLEKNKNYLISIAGRIDWARENQMNITSKWLISENRKVIIEEL